MNKGRLCYVDARPFAKKARFEYIRFDVKTKKHVLKTLGANSHFFSTKHKIVFCS